MGRKEVRGPTKKKAPQKQNSRQKGGGGGGGGSKPYQKGKAGPSKQKLNAQRKGSESKGKKRKLDQPEKIGVSELLQKASKKRQDAEEDDIILDDDDYAFLQDNPSFAAMSSLDFSQDSKNSKKRKREGDDDNFEKDFEKAPRTPMWGQNERSHRMPTIVNGKVVYPSQTAHDDNDIGDDNDNDNDNDGAGNDAYGYGDDDDTHNNNPSLKIMNKNKNRKKQPDQDDQDTMDLLDGPDSDDSDNNSNSDSDNSDNDLHKALKAVVEMKKRRVAVKQRIAANCMAVMEDPQNNFKKLGELVHLCLDKDVSLARLAIVSCAALFKDIIPGYAIRETSDGDDDKLSRQYGKIRSFELALLSSYKNYLMALNKAIKGTLVSNINPAQTTSLRVVAVDALGLILGTHPHFNFRKNVMATLVPCLEHSNRHVASTAADAMRSAMQHDPTGQHTLDLIRLISTEIQRKNFQKGESMLTLMLHTPLRTDLLTDNALVEKSKLKRKKKKKDDIDKELAQAEAEFTKETILATHQAILASMFVTYARVLKKAIHSPLMPLVLQGMGKFGHLVDMSLLQDIVVNLKNMLVDNSVKRELKMEAFLTLHALKQGEAQALNIDLKHAHVCLYQILGEMIRPVPNTQLQLMVRCLQRFLKDRKLLEPTRAASFIKRMLAVCLCQPPHMALALLVVVRALLEAVPTTQQLFDQETTQLGTYGPEVQDPDYANGLSSGAWELTVLAASTHPPLASLARQVAKFDKICHLPGFPGVSVDHVVKIFHTFDASLGAFNPPVPVPKVHPLKKRAEKGGKAVGRPLGHKPLRILVAPHTPNAASDQHTLQRHISAAQIRRRQLALARRIAALKLTHLAAQRARASNHK